MDNLIIDAGPIRQNAEASEGKVFPVEINADNNGFDLKLTDDHAPVILAHLPDQSETSIDAWAEQLQVTAESIYNHSPNVLISTPWGFDEQDGIASTAIMWTVKGDNDQSIDGEILLVRTDNSIQIKGLTARSSDSNTNPQRLTSTVQEILRYLETDDNHFTVSIANKEWDLVEQTIKEQIDKTQEATNVTQIDDPEPLVVHEEIPEVKQVRNLLNKMEEFTTLPNLLEAFRKAYPEGSERILHDHVEQVLEATNTIRRLIESGAMDALSAEQAFNLIHFIHTGEGEPSKAIIATANFRGLEHLSAQSYYGRTEAAALEYQNEKSYLPYHYRTSYVRWGEYGRGAIGIELGQVPQFASDYFTHVDQFVTEASTNQYHPDYVFPILLSMATVADIAHLKGDCNGRTCEDFLVWMQRRIYEGKRAPICLSDHGLRAPGAVEAVKPEYYDSALELYLRINKRNDVVIALRKALFVEMAQINEMSPEELEQFMMQPVAGDITERQQIMAKRQKIHQALGKILGNIIDTNGSAENRLTRKALEDVNEFYSTNGKTEYHYLSPEIIKD